MWAGGSQRQHHWTSIFDGVIKVSFYALMSALKALLSTAFKKTLLLPSRGSLRARFWKNFFPFIPENLFVYRNDLLICQIAFSFQRSPTKKRQNIHSKKKLPYRECLAFAHSSPSWLAGFDLNCEEINLN